MMNYDDLMKVLVAFRSAELDRGRAHCYLVEMGFTLVEADIVLNRQKVAA